MRRPPALKNTRNGLKWRDGRPRWEPSPASRKLGLKGCDLKDLEDRWIADRGLAMSLADARHAWALAIREAAQDAPEAEAARAELRAALEGLEAPQTPEQRLRRAIVQDLVDHARRLLDGQDAAAGVTMARGVRTVERLVEAYFAAVDAGEVKIKPATRQAYSAQRAPFLARFAGRGVASIRRAELQAWYNDLLETESVSNANLRLGGVAAFLRWAWDQEWVPASPAVKLGKKKAKGRRVFWTLEEEAAFVAWCDAHGYPDVADGVTAGLWTGARLVDLCAANVEDLQGAVWRFTPIKTERHEQEAMPGILPQLRARVDRRDAEARAAPVRFANATPFLWYASVQRRHDPDSYYRRFREARAAALADEHANIPESLADKRQQDTRDTCVTRLWLADVDPSRIWTWTGHSKASCDEILKEHYLVLREEGQVDMARKLEAWAKAAAVSL